jgi:hypothetical protein
MIGDEDGMLQKKTRNVGEGTSDRFRGLHISTAVFFFSNISVL